MMRNSIQNKLKEQKGASLVLALFLLIVVTVVATIIVNSAFSNAGRVRRNIRAEQNYLTVSSAAELVKEYLGDVTIVYTKTDTETKESSSESWRTYNGGEGDRKIWVFRYNYTDYYVEGYKNRNTAYSELINQINSGTAKQASDEAGVTGGDYTNWDWDNWYRYYPQYKVKTITSGGTTSSTSEEYSFTDAKGSSGISDVSTSDNPFAAQLKKWLESNKNSQTESKATYIIQTDGMKPVKAELCIDKANFVDKGSGGSTDMDKATTYIIANLSIAKSTTEDGTGGTSGNTLSAKNGDENYYMSVKIPFTSVKEETNVTNSGGTRSASDEGYDTELSSLSDEPDEANYSDEPDEANFLYDSEDDVAVLADDDATTVTTTTWTVQTASAKGESNNIDIEKGVKQSNTN